MRCQGFFVKSYLPPFLQHDFGVTCVMKYLIAIDIDTSGTKRVLFDTEGNAVAEKWLTPL